MLRVALEQVREHGPQQRYAAIVVDEAQDITEVGVRFLLELLEGGPAGRIMLVGDSGQRIYPGGYRLADLGLEIRGRSFALAVCYRSTDEIMQAVGALGQFLSTEEFGDDGLRSVGAARSAPVRGHPYVVRHADDEQGWILDQLDPTTPRSTRRPSSPSRTTPCVDGAVHWKRRHRLGAPGGLPRPAVPGVKVGTYHRAKGLEFERLFLPGLDCGFPFVGADEDDSWSTAPSSTWP